MMTDPISDMLTRIRNAQKAEKLTVRLPASSVKRGIAQVLKAEGYIEGFSEASEGVKAFLDIQLKYHAGQPVISQIERMSKPGQRLYRGKGELPRVSGGMGVAVVSTSKGVMTDREARRQGLGGEVLCIVS
jgi:small subunit ribosomal protein S8